MAGTNGTILIKKKDWDRLLTTVETLIEVHAQLLRRSKELCDELKYRKPQIKREHREKRQPSTGFCGNCGREVLESDRYCDRCGFEVVR